VARLAPRCAAWRAEPASRSAAERITPRRTWQAPDRSESGERPLRTPSSL
jgi:hypothetical protein